MRPTSIYARNFRTYPLLDIEFPDGLVGVVGELRNQADGADSNGAGKSSILEAIDIALFGRRALAPYLTRGLTGEELLLELALEHAGDLYRIRRSFKPKKTPTLDFEIADRLNSSGDHWQPLTCASAKETQQLIEATIGLSRDTYRNSSYLRQGEGSFADPALDPRARRSLLTAAVFGNDSTWPARQQQARDDRARLHEQHLAATGLINLAQETVEAKAGIVAERDTVVEAETELADTIADLERAHAALSEQYQDAREQGARRAAAEAELREATSTVAQLTRRAAEADEAARAIAAATADLEQLPATTDTASLEAREVDLMAAVQHHAQLSNERDVLLREHDRLTNERDQLVAQVQQSDQAAETVRAKITATEATEDATCETCGQHVAGDAKAKTLTTYRADLDAHLARSKELFEQARAIVMPHVPPGLPPAPTVELQEVRDQLRTIRDAATRRAQLEERVRQLETAAAGAPAPAEMTAALVAVTEKQAVLDQLAPVDLADITRQGTLVKQRLETARGSIAGQRALRARLDERLSQVAAAEVALAEAEAERKTLGDSLAVVSELERIYGPAGIPTLVLENIAIPQIEAEANRLLSLLGCPYTVELRTQADKVDGGIKETFDVIVIDQTGDEAPFEECTSGGEKTRIGLALRIALARLLSHRRGAESRILCLDEPSYLDEAGMRALLAVLAELQTDFDTILLVSHVAELRDSFDTTLNVIRDGATSRIDTGDREAVAA